MARVSDAALKHWAFGHLASTLEAGKAIHVPPYPVVEGKEVILTEVQKDMVQRLRKMSDDALS